jgi:hypothetical protein
MPLAVPTLFFGLRSSDSGLRSPTFLLQSPVFRPLSSVFGLPSPTFLLPGPPKPSAPKVVASSSPSAVNLLSTTPACVATSYRCGHHCLTPLLLMRTIRESAPSESPKVRPSEPSESPTIRTSENPNHQNIRQSTRPLLPCAGLPFRCWVAQAFCYVGQFLLLFDT